MRGRAVRLLPVAGMAAFGCVIGAASSASAAPPPVQATPVDGPSVPLSLPNVRALWGVLSVPGVLPTRVNPPSLPGRPGEVATCVPVPGIGQFGPTEPPNPPSLPGRPGEVATCVPAGVGQFGPTEPPNPPSLPGRPGEVATCVPVPGIGQLWPPVLLDPPSVHGGGILTCVAVTGGGNLCMSRLHRRRIATWVPTPQVGKLRRRGLPGRTTTTTTTTPPATTLVGGGANNGGNGGGGNHNGSSGTGSTGGASAGSGASPSGASAGGGSLAHTGFDPMPFLAGGPAALIAGTAVCVQGPRRSCAEPD